MQYLKDPGGAQQGTKIAYLCYDNPAGREPLPVFHRICTLEGYECRDFAVPAPGVEMAAQVLDITRRMQAEWVVGHLFSTAPAVSIQAFTKNGFPLDRVVSLFAGAGEEGMQVAGWDAAQGSLGIHVTEAGRDVPVIQAIVPMYQAEHQDVPAYVDWTTYNFGVLIPALLVEGIRLAIEPDGLPVTGETIKMGYERIKDFILGGFLPSLTVTPEDHEGGSWVRLTRPRASSWCRSRRGFAAIARSCSRRSRRPPRPKRRSK